MLERQTFKNQDLVLKVSENVDPRVFDINKYEPFLDALCGEREYQKEAIRITLRYLLGGQYKNLKELAEENYHQNPILQEKYTSFNDLVKVLQLPEKFYCSLDLATGTGKSFILYGLARIMLAERVVDQVLVLCPSTTIEDGLLDKFHTLSADKTLRDLLKSAGVKVLNPGIINATESIKKGDICVENVHAVYKHVKSAIRDSLKGKGERTLVLNDEVHHMVSGPKSELKKWKEFLLDSDFNFKYIVGDSGTCYIKDDYFADVIYRFSLRQSIEEKFVKTFRYAIEGVPKNESEKFQWIYENHKRNKKKYYKIKPLTILVTKDIAACKRLTEKWIKFIAEKEKNNIEKVKEKVLIVTSAKEHEENIPKLKNVDDKNSPIEWITSVSMLSEGWDVENVFQIVPHEERAEDVVLFDASDIERPIGLNMLEARDPGQRDFAVQEMIAIFYKLFPPEIIGPMFEHNMRNVMLTLMADHENPGTIAEIPRMFSDPDYAKIWIEKLKDPVVRAFWEKEMARTTEFHKSEMLGYLISKVGRFVENEMMRNIIGQSHSGINFREIMDKQKILLVNLSKGKIGEVNANLLGLVIVSKLQMAAMARAELPEAERKDFYLYIDEFQNFITDSIATILSEARKYRLSLVMAHQYLGQLLVSSSVVGGGGGEARIRDAVLGTVGTFVTFKVGIEDAEILAKEYKPVFNEYDMINVEKFNAYIKLLVDNQPTRPFNMVTIPPKPGDRRVAEAIRQLSRLKYGRLKAIVEAEILERSRLGAPARQDIGREKNL